MHLYLKALFIFYSSTSHFLYSRYLLHLHGLTETTGEHHLFKKLGMLVVHVWWFYNYFIITYFILLLIFLLKVVFLPFFFWSSLNFCTFIRKNESGNVKLQKEKLIESQKARKINLILNYIIVLNL